jgi:hypothetical protein
MTSDELMPPKLTDEHLTPPPDWGEAVPEGAVTVKRQKVSPRKVTEAAASEKPDEKPPGMLMDGVPTSSLARSDVERFREMCRKASIEPGKPLYMLLSTVHHSVLELRDLVGGAARGLTPEGEADLIQRVERQAQVALRQSMAEHRIRLSRWTSAAVGLGAVLCLVGGTAVGYWYGWSAGQSAVGRVSQEVAVAFSQGTENAEAVARLLRHNDLPSMMRECRRFEVDGRDACAGAWWTEPAPVAPVPTK